MREQTCEQCGQKHGLNELISVFGSVLCRSCGDQKLNASDKDQINEKTVFPLSDPTVCARCGTDGGSQEFPLFLDMPICQTCKDTMVNYRYPAWVKAFFAGILIIVVFSLVWNFRFFQARVLMEQAIKAGFAQGNVEAGSNKMQKASNLVPESHELRVLSHYLEGVRAIRKDDCQSALDHFQNCNELPEAYQVELFQRTAEIGVAFDNKDYQKFLELAMGLRDSNPNDSTAEGQIASAYACLYAERGDESDKQKALEHLQRAEDKTTPNDRERFKEYRERITYRLETRRILTRKEYYEETGKTPPEDLE